VLALLPAGRPAPGRAPTCEWRRGSGDRNRRLAARNRDDGSPHGRSPESPRDTLRAPIFEDKVIDFIVELAKIVERKFTPQEPAGHTRPCRRRCVTELTRSEPSAARAALPGRP
jgi:hypothetical protein